MHIAYFIVPVIAVFTKYDQFKDNIEIDLERHGCANWETESHAEAERVFQEQYLGKLGEMCHFVRLESKVLEGSWASGANILCTGMHKAGEHCTELLEKTANALSDNVVGVMLLAVQKGNLELSINRAVTKSVFLYGMARKSLIYYFRACIMIRSGEKERGKIIGKCVVAFPYMWYYVSVLIVCPVFCLLTCSLLTSM